MKARNERLRCQLYERDEAIAALESQQLEKSRRARAAEVQQAATQRLLVDEKIQALADRIAALEEKLQHDKSTAHKPLVRISQEDYQTMQNLIESQRRKISELESKLESV